MSKNGEFAKLCAALPGLSPDELAQLRLRIGFLARDTPAPAAGTRRTSGSDWLLRGIGDELHRRGLSGSGKIPAQKLRADWDEVSARMQADLLHALGDKGDRSTGALGALTARVLADWLAAGRVPISPKTMLQNVEKVFTALDEAFPGYVQAGMLRCCLTPELVGVE